MVERRKSLDNRGFLGLSRRRSSSTQDSRQKNIHRSSKRLIGERNEQFCDVEKRITVETNRRKEVGNVCLSTFVSKGLAETSSRDLSKALELQSGGLYYYFGSKDDAVLACAEEAAVRLEDRLITPVFKDINDPESLYGALIEDVLMRWPPQ